MAPSKALGSRFAVPALAWAGFGVVAEIKRASPSAGAIADHPLAPWARGLELGGAAMLSVLTEERFFSGSLRTLEEVAELVSLPLLRKDFLVHPTELDEARAHGASAVLLIAAGLSPSELRLMFSEARARGLGVLLEVHEERELERAFSCDPFTQKGVMLGINQRNLETLEVDPRYAERIARALPAGVRFIVESGVKSVDDVRFARAIGASGVLVGEALARAPDPGARLREWLEQSGR